MIERRDKKREKTYIGDREEEREVGKTEKKRGS